MDCQKKQHSSLKKETQYHFKLTEVITITTREDWWVILQTSINIVFSIGDINSDIIVIFSTTTIRLVEIGMKLSLKYISLYQNAACQLSSEWSQFRIKFKDSRTIITRGKKKINVKFNSSSLAGQSKFNILDSRFEYKRKDLKLTDFCIQCTAVQYVQFKGSANKAYVH